MPENGGEPPAKARSPVVRGGRSLAGEIRTRREWIEAELRAGHSRAQIAEALGEVGVVISAENLKKALYRARREDGRKSADAATSGIALAPTVPPPRAPQAPTMTPSATREPTPTPIPGVEAASPPPEAAIPRLTMREAMDPKKRAEFAAQFFETPPLVLRPKPKSES